MLFRSDTLAQKLQAKGVHIHESAPVEKITLNNNQVSGIQVQGQPEESFERAISTIPMEAIADSRDLPL